KDIMTYDIYVQMVEIYNEHVRDLLTEDKIDNKLEIRSCNDDGLSLPYATLCPVGVVLPTVYSPCMFTEKIHEIHGSRPNRRSSLGGKPVP
ncbi:hypothetical protein S83_054463, partial [Arachis hypogaea]